MAPRRRQDASYPLYNTTFLLHRVSPLYVGAKTTLLEDEYLADHARRFRDILRGHVLRGVQIYPGSGNQEGLGKPGSLRKCQWTVLGSEERWMEHHKRELMGDESNDTPRPGQIDLAADDAKGVLVEIEYENITYQALLLGDSDMEKMDTDDGFMHLPLLLTRMPGFLRKTLIDYLATSFDTRISQMKPPTDFLPTALERCFADLVVGQDRLQRSETIKSVVGHVQVTLKPSDTVTSMLRSVEIDIPKADVPLFLATGQNLSRKTASLAPTAGQKRKRNMTDRSDNDRGPFTAALSNYLASHAALHLSHSGITISKVACKVFVLGAEGKIKIFQSTRHSMDEENEENVGPSSTATAVKRLIMSLIEAAKSKRALRVVSKNALNRRQDLEGAMIEQVEVDLPPPYELHDPSRAWRV